LFKIKQYNLELLIKQYNFRSIISKQYIRARYKEERQGRGSEAFNKVHKQMKIEIKDKQLMCAI